MYFKVKLYISLFLISLCSEYAEAQAIPEFVLKKLCNEKDVGAVAYPGSQSKFIVCLNDKVHVDECSVPGTCFDERKQICSLCGQSSENIHLTNYVKAKCEQHELWFTAVAAPTDCTHYYFCMDINTIPVYTACPENTHFSDKQKKCVSPAIAGCVSTEKICLNVADDIQFATTNCFDYYECSNQKAVLKSCAYNEHFDETAGRCIPIKKSKCVEKGVRKPTCNETNEGMYFAHPKCNQYYMCFANNVYEVTCETNSYFNKEENKCTNTPQSGCSM
ncbi:peritrophin-44-like [Teleopsis dalmanni]|uniref:peritrophin-44-like n=1 Tax=Teleopsis dalmanni TaxID=139649 RepID=UPI0018CF6CEC|nr:peritrophin-44-like [Teleopsis dalmanni]